MHYTCDSKTGKYINDGSNTIPESTKVPSIHAETGLAVEYLGTAGYRLYFHNETRTIHELAYTSANTVGNSGPVSNDPASSMALAAALYSKTNLTITYVRDQSNIGVTNYNSDGNWHVCMWHHTAV